MANTILCAAVGLGLLSLWIWLLSLVIRALRKYVRSGPVRREKAEACRSLGEALKKHRMERQSF